MFCRKVECYSIRRKRGEAKTGSTVDNDKGEQIVPDLQGLGLGFSEFIMVQK